MTILILILLELTGLLMVVYNFQMVKIFGHPEWAEKTFGAGGSYLAWRLIGICVMIGGLLAYKSGLLAGLVNR